MPAPAQVQLIMQLYLDAKQVQHKTYEALRAPEVMDLMDSPLFKRAQTISTPLVSRA